MNEGGREREREGGREGREGIVEIHEPNKNDFKMEK